jgi:hypothetical protein
MMLIGRAGWKPAVRTADILTPSSFTEQKTV